MCERARIALVTAALLLAHCAWSTPGLGVSVSVVSDDAPGPILDARGDAHVVERAALRIESLALIACPGEPTPLARSPFAPARARAHDESETEIGPLVVDLVDPAPLELGRLPLVPGRYCDARLRVAAASDTPTLQLDAGTMSVESTQTRETLVRLAPISLAPAQRDAQVVLRASLASALERIDPSVPDPIADGASALGALLGAIRAQ